MKWNKPAAALTSPSLYADRAHITVLYVNFKRQTTTQKISSEENP